MNWEQNRRAGGEGSSGNANSARVPDWWDGDPMHLPGSATSLPGQTPGVPIGPVRVLAQVGVSSSLRWGRGASWGARFREGP